MREEDIPAIAAILNAEILGGTASWQSDPRTATEMADWARVRIEAGAPVLIAEIPGVGVGGYASWGPFRSGPGYRHTVEHSVYVAPFARRRGVARLLMAELIDRARAAGLHAMVGGVSADQQASLALHLALGFRECGRLPQVGAKFGRWLDLALMHLQLDSQAAPSD